MENIKVAVRIRPLLKREIEEGEENSWVVHDKSTLSLKSQIRLQSASFSFDHCFEKSTKNQVVYEEVVKPISLSCLSGINGTVFMYGTTGSGKTFTMMGEDIQGGPQNSQIHYEPAESGCWSPNQKGILFMALSDLFKSVEEDKEKTYFIRCSYVEIYNDQVFDLLRPRAHLGDPLTISEDSNHEFYIKGIREADISSIEEAIKKLKDGEANRHYAETALNHTSSRSHTLFRLLVHSATSPGIRELREKEKSPNVNSQKMKELISSSEFFDIFKGREERGTPVKISKVATETDGLIVTESILNFVDLAGSEKASSHQKLKYPLEDSNYFSGFGDHSTFFAKERIKEGQSINKSLFFLTQVISIKSEDNPGHFIPFRNSPLTKLLKSSLGGNSRTLIILCVTPTISSIEHTFSTLRFGLSAKKIENTVKTNIATNDEHEAIQLIVRDYEKKIKNLEKMRKKDKSKISHLEQQVRIFQASEMIRKPRESFSVSAEGRKPENSMETVSEAEAGGENKRSQRPSQKTNGSCKENREKTRKSIIESLEESLEGISEHMKDAQKEFEAIETQMSLFFERFESRNACLLSKLDDFRKTSDGFMDLNQKLSELSDEKLEEHEKRVLICLEKLKYERAARHVSAKHGIKVKRKESVLVIDQFLEGLKREISERERGGCLKEALTEKVGGLRSLFKRREDASKTSIAKTREIVNGFFEELAKEERKSKEQRNSMSNRTSVTVDENPKGLQDKINILEEHLSLFREKNNKNSTLISSKKQLPNEKGPSEEMAHEKTPKRGDLTPQSSRRGSQTAMKSNNVLINNTKLREQLTRLNTRTPLKEPRVQRDKSGRNSKKNKENEPMSTTPEPKKHQPSQANGKRAGVWRSNEFSLDRLESHPENNILPFFGRKE